MQKLTHLSLFTGVGGLDLAAEWAGFQTVGQCEWADYPHALLEKRWPDVPKWRDVHEFSATKFFKRTGLTEVTCISGGFPCQPHSVAGKRQASLDDRDLWPEYRRIICEIKPRWVVAENVRGLLLSEDGRFFLGILRDLADLGYDAAWGTFSAASVGAVHRRERVAIVAHTNAVRLQGWVSAEELQKADEQFERICLHLLRRADAQCLSKSCFRRAADGPAHWVDRLKCLGNMVVPQQFYPVFKAIAEIEERERKQDER